jgi:hypothetical protein
MSGAIADLIARLATATAPDPHLDAEIEAALHGGEPAYRAASRHQFGPSVVLNHGAGNPWDGWESARSFTGSLEAALTLWETPRLDRDFPRRGINLFYSVQPGGKLHWAAVAWEWKDGSSVILQHGDGRHLIRPISACIAALRARTESRGQQ